MPHVLKTLERLGASPQWPAYPSMLLGAGGLRLIEVADMYQTLANGGFNTPLRGIRSVVAADGEPLSRYPFKIQQRFDPGAIYLTQYAMQRAMFEGTGRSVYNHVPRSLTLAGKTGTTNDLRDSWFAGFSDDLVAVTWLGRDDNGQTRLTGATGALQVWAAFMAQAHPQRLSEVPPEGILYAWVDRLTGQGSDSSCPDTVQVPFREGYQPLPGPGCQPVLEAEPESERRGRVRDVIRGWLQ